MRKIIFLGGDIVISRDNLEMETASVCPSTETKITCSHVFVDEILGTWRAGRPKTSRQLGSVRWVGGVQVGENDVYRG